MKSTAGRAILFSLLLLGALAALTPRAFAQGGVPLWTNRYHGVGIGDNYASAVVVDNNGNVFVTGYSSGPNGVQPYNWDYGMITYSSAGVPLWTNRYNGPGDSWDNAEAILVNSNGDVFVTGGSDRENVSPRNRDYATVAYSNAGVPLWTNRYNGPGDDYDTALAVAVDASGDLFVTGVSAGVGTGEDYATVAYSSTGVPLWTNRYDGPGGGDDRALAIAVNSNGQVFVTGYSTGTNGYHDYATVAYSHAGQPLWTNRYEGTGQPFHYDADAYGVRVDNNGDVVVTGRRKDVSYDYVTIKYSSAGAPLWTNHFDNGTKLNYFPSQPIAVDSTGNVFVIRVSSNSSVRYGYVAIKYSSAGLPLWTNRYMGPGNSTNWAEAVIVDSGGNVLVTGHSQASGGGDFATLAYSNAGVALWTNRYHGPWTGNDYPVAFALDSSGNAVVTGNSHGTNSYYDFVTIKYSSSIPPVYLDFQLLNNELVLSWTNGGFSLQTAPASTGKFTNLPGATSPYTNPITAAQQFFRLKKN